MKANYKPLGEYIRLVDERNSALEDLPLVGISISKQFIQSVANIIGTDLSNYKLIKKNQFACSLMQVSRDEKIPIGMFSEEKAIMSPAYPVFEVKDKAVLMPEYLQMWFERSEFDRQASFYAVGGVRGNLPWDDFLELELPVPHIDKQRAIVKEYNTIQNRIALNQQLIQKLEETAQAIYKAWFVEFENNIEPKTIGDLFTPKKGRNITREKAIEGIFPVVAGGLEPSCYHNEFNTSKPVVTISASGANAGFVRLYHSNVWAADCSYVDNKVFKEVYFAYVSLKTSEALLMSKQQGTGQPHIYPEHIITIPIFGLTEEKLKSFNEHCKAIFNRVEIAEKENQKLTELKELLLSRLATKEN